MGNQAEENSFMKQKVPAMQGMLDTQRLTALKRSINSWGDKQVVDAADQALREEVGGGVWCGRCIYIIRPGGSDVVTAKQRRNYSGGCYKSIHIRHDHIGHKGWLALPNVRRRERGCLPAIAIIRVDNDAGPSVFIFNAFGSLVSYLLGFCCLVI